MTDAFSRAIAILFDPFDLRRWLKLSLLCLFLGGGATWAAIHGSLGALPGEINADRALLRLRLFLAHHPTAGMVAALAAVVLGIGLIYLRAFCRFALVDSILRGEVRLRQSWSELRPLARSYFRWLLAALLLLGLTLAAGILAALPLLRGGPRSVVASILLAAIVSAQLLVSLIAALAITLTDDLVVPMIYAERRTLPAAWRRLAAAIQSNAGAFVLYVLLRFVVSIGVGIVVLIILFVALVALFSGAVIVSVLFVLGLRLMGLDWAWTPVTAIIAGAALLILVGPLLLVLGAVSMPGLVFLQAFGIRFIAPRVPALAALWSPEVTPIRG